MARNSSLYVRKAAVARLKLDAGVIALVTAARVYPPQRPSTPVWPFVAFGVPITDPFRASGMDGSETDVAIHGYAATGGAGAQTVGGEELCSQIMAAVETALDGVTLDLTANDCPYPATAFLTWQNTAIVQDDEDGHAFHGIANFRITVAS